MLGETPWVDRTMTKVWERISRAAPRPTWMPRHTIKKNESVRVSELGCGHYGCVMVTADPMVVCKLTSDPTEAAFIAAALSLGEVPDGVVKYHAVFSIPGMTHNRRPVFVLWRETALHVGLDNIRRAITTPDRPAMADDDRRGLDRLANFLERFRNHAAGIRDALKKRARPYELVEEARRFKTVLDAGGFHSLAEQRQHPADVQRVGFSLQALEEIVEEMQQTYLCDSIGEALALYLENGLVLADVHANNVGLVARQKAPVITDPGHAVPISTRWRQVSIPELP
jgi:hypothetical protein